MLARYAPVFGNVPSQDPGSTRRQFASIYKPALGSAQNASLLSLPL